jgi:hypothetical protein
MNSRYDRRERVGKAPLWLDSGNNELKHSFAQIAQREGILPHEGCPSHF